MNTCKSIAAGLAATAAMSAPALAGDTSKPVMEPVPVAPVVSTPPADYGTDWTGFYGGLQLGYGDVGSDVGDGDGGIYGLHAGYNHDFGKWVAGAEIDYDKLDIDAGDSGETFDDIARLKLRAGYDLGNTLIYATAGSARVYSNAGDDTGPFYGIGASYMVSDSWMVGAEALRHDFDNDTDLDTITLRASYKF